MTHHGSLFAGIGGFDLGFERAGWQTVWQVEQELFCRKVLASRFPGAERLEDVRDVGAHNLKPVDCITAGVPCQDVSVAGKRAGLAGERTGLFYEFARILRELRPAWFVFENVPGFLSSNRGRDFAEVLRVLMVECGYGVAWRVLNSQFFGVAQRRRRVFLVGRFGGPCPAEVLFEPESGAGDSQAGGEAGQDVAYALAASVRGTGDGHGQGWNSNYAVAATLPADHRFTTDSHVDNLQAVASVLRESDGHHGRSSPRGDGGDNLIVQQAISSKWAKGSSGPAGDEHHNLVCATLNSGGNDGGFRSEPGEHIGIQEARGQREKRKNGIGIQEGGPSYTLDGTSQHAVAYPVTGHSGWRGEDRDTYIPDGSTPSDSHRVRDFTRLPAGLDSARYRALGNAVTVQVGEWIARRIRELGVGEKA